MKLKCIGGPNHGEYKDVGNNYHNGEYVQLPKRIELASVQFNYSKSIPPSLEIPIEVYIVDDLKYSVDSQIYEWKFLRYHKHNIITIFDLLLK